MAKFGLFTGEQKLQEYEGDRIDQSGEYVQIVVGIGDANDRIVAAIRLAPGQYVKQISGQK
ncbi:MAG: hypothetical protein L0338_38905 [Acidobacteria bacterium]|nr:hypothetical protein [Acidobacteriota bacterium]